MHILKSVDVMSVARITGLVYGGLGLIFVPIFLLFLSFGTLVGRGDSTFAGIFFYAMAVLMPISYGVMGFIVGAIAALLYNIAARWVGGIELDLDSVPVLAGSVGNTPISSL
jgi:hypothetical protein